MTLHGNNSKKPLTAVVFSSADGARFLNEKHPEVYRILALTPDSRASLLNVDIPILSSLDKYSDYGHLRTIVRVRRAKKSFIETLESVTDLSVATKEGLRGEFYIMASCATRLWETLKNTGPWLIPTEKSWCTTSDRKEAHICLLHHLTRQTIRPSYGTPPLPYLFRWINRLVAKILCKNNPVFFNNFGYGGGFLAGKLSALKTPVRSFEIREATGRWKDYIIPIYTLAMAALGKKSGSLAVGSEISPQVAAQIAKILQSVHDPVIQPCMEIFSSFIINQTAYATGMLPEIKALLTISRPRRIIGNFFKWGVAAALAESGKNLNIPCTLIAHGTLFSSHNSTSAAALNEMKELARGVLLSPLADETIVQSPHAEGFIKKIDPSVSRQLTYPIMWAYRDVPKQQIDGKRCILHTGTFKNWFGSRPWIFETGDEFIEGLVSLVLTTQHLKNTKLVIRIRPLIGCGLSTLQKLLPKSDHYEIKTSGLFLDDLAKADLVVSWASTTIEEALHARRPVLLWGGSRRHNYLPPSTTFPTKDKRKTVYAPETEKDLAPMLDSILNAHKGLPLTDKELQGHFWPSEAPKVDDYIQQIGRSQ